VIVQDPTLVHQVDLFGGLGDDGYVLLNTARSFEELGLGEYVERFAARRCVAVPATDTARERLGRPLPNAALLGAFAALTSEVSVESVAAAIRDRFPGQTGERNVAAAEEAHELVLRTTEASHA
jgi:pyruvate ferredoxin oxidoreductase gamma subunit